MNKWKNIKLDDETMWPKEGLVELDAPHSDDRGFIQSLVNFPMKNISLIFSKKDLYALIITILPIGIICMCCLVLLITTLNLQIAMKKLTVLELKLEK